MKLRSHLVALTLAVLVPMIIFAVVVVAMFGRQQRRDVEQGAVETARALINAADERLNGSRAATCATCVCCSWTTTARRSSWRRPF